MAHRQPLLPGTEVTLYVHSSRERVLEIGEKLGLTGTPLEIFKYLGYEHKLTYVVDVTTGMGTLVAVDGRRLTDA
jgi:hypothetical protein